MFVADIMGDYASYERGYKAIEGPLLEHARNREAVVQAGGHIGLFPRELAKHFKSVYTFEPEPENFACLVRNADQPNVFAMRAFLGHTRGCRELRVNSKSSGGHSVGQKPGFVPTFRIDDLKLDACGAIVLDLEGYEFFALIGALDTIARCKPVIITEENKKAYNQGVQPGAIALLLRSRNYRKPEVIGENLVFYT